MKKDLRFEDLTREDQFLLSKAEIALKNSYNPYSDFSVGATLLSINGATVSGSNYENAAYSPCICAERSALMAGNSRCIRSFSKIAIIARIKDGSTHDIITPCGTCRQMLFEASQISGVDIEVIMSNTEMTKITIATIGELLPLAFGPKDLGKDVSKFA